MQKRLLPFLLLYIFCFTHTKTFATHIVGGEMNYKYLGFNNYEIRLTVYRDCYVGVPPFDSPATVGIFDKNNNPVQTLLMIFRGLDTLQPTISDPCTIPPLDFCYEVTTYIDTINLPPLVGGYQISYQRCCRNINILNLINPECIGATYYASIPGSEVVPINSNPVFKNWPPPFICVNKQWVFDNGAIDADGDSLVYELWQPFNGLNASCPIISNSIPNSAPNCGAPPPSCTNTPVPPPFFNVPWKSPYNTLNMLGGIPMVVNAQTGLVTATPNLQGYFVIGIIVKEYRNGVFLSETKRDFQLIIKPCPSVVVAAAQAPQAICGTTSVNFGNNSTGNSLNFNWNFGDNSTLADTSHVTTPTYVYPGTGTYTVTLIAYVSNKPLCNDTVVTAVSISNNFKGVFTFTPIPCSNNKVEFSGKVQSPPGTTPVWNWNFGDGETSNVQNPIHTYTSAGSYPTVLVTYIPNSINCIDTLVAQTVYINPNPEIFIPNTFTPNGDGHNDVFIVRCPLYQVFYFAVYNRWGELMFETTDPLQGWDGLYKGNLADPGAFGYYMKAQCSPQSEEIFRKGNVTLIR